MVTAREGEEGGGGWRVPWRLATLVNQSAPTAARACNADVAGGRKRHSGTLEFMHRSLLLNLML